MARPKYSLKGFVAWLEKKPPNRTFNYVDRCRCVNSRFHKACGRKYETVPVWWPFPRKGEPLRETIERIAVRSNRTYGGVLRMAKELIS